MQIIYKGHMDVLFFLYRAIKYTILQILFKEFVIGNWFQVTRRLGIFSVFLKFRLLKTLE